MKYLLIKLIFAITVINVLSHTHKVQTTNVFQEAEAKYFAKFAKMAFCAKKPINQTCQQCINPGDNFKLFFFMQANRLNKYPFKFLIHYNDEKKQIVISIGGPSVQHHHYFNIIYANGWAAVKGTQFKIEKEYQHVYYGLIQKTLKEKVDKINKSGRGHYRYIFTGHSIGGSIASLAAFDLISSGLINKVHNNVTAYTIGSLRIGDSNFVSLLNSYYRLYRVVKDDDYVVRAPNCFYSALGRVWRCLSQPQLTRKVFERDYPMRSYYTSYRSPVVFRASSFLERQVRMVHKHPNRYNHRLNMVRNVYYSQPAGVEVFYTSNMNRFSSCRYINGVANCERKIVLPATFTTVSHNNYYGLRFDVC